MVGTFQTIIVFSLFNKLLHLCLFDNKKISHLISCETLSIKIAALISVLWFCLQGVQTINTLYNYIHVYIMGFIHCSIGILFCLPCIWSVYFRCGICCFWKKNCELNHVFIVGKIHFLSKYCFLMLSFPFEFNASTMNLRFGKIKNP